MDVRHLMHGDALQTSQEMIEAYSAYRSYVRRNTEIDLIDHLLQVVRNLRDPADLPSKVDVINEFFTPEAYQLFDALTSAQSNEHSRWYLLEQTLISSNGQLPVEFNHVVKAVRTIRRTVASNFDIDWTRDFHELSKEEFSAWLQHGIVLSEVVNFKPLEVKLCLNRIFNTEIVPQGAIDRVDSSDRYGESALQEDCTSEQGAKTDVTSSRNTSADTSADTSGLPDAGSFDQLEEAHSMDALKRLLLGGK